MTRKHEANIKKSKLITVQLWIIAVLSFSFFMYEVSTYSEPVKNIAEKIYTSEDNSNDPDRIYDGVDIWKETKTETQPKATAKPTEIAPIEVDNKTPEPKIEDIKTEPEVKEQPKTSDIRKAPLDNPTKKTASKTGTASAKNKKAYTARTVDFLPVFPGCDRYSTNSERATCFEKKVKRLVLNKFNNNLGQKLGLKGIQRINLYFEIDKNGVVSNIKANSKGQIFELEKEAIRVAKKLPKMEPAKAGNTAVKMAYDMPITFDAR